jgi:hypothetical protein
MEERACPYTVALIECASWKNVLKILKRNLYKIAYIKLSIFGKNWEPGYSYRY